MNGLSDGLMIAVLSADQRAGRRHRLPLHPLHPARQNRGRLPRNRRDESHRAAGCRHPNASIWRSTRRSPLRAACSGSGCPLCFRRLAAREYPPVFGRERKRGPGSASWGVSASCWSFSTILAYVNGVLRRFRQISPAQAIRFGYRSGKAAGRSKRFRLSANRLLNTNVFLGVRRCAGPEKNLRHHAGGACHRGLQHHRAAEFA